MRILYIHQYFSTRAGATGTRSYEFSRHLIEQGHQVTMITGTTWLSDLPRTGLVTRTKIDGIDVVAIGVKYANYMGFLRRIWAMIAFMLASVWVARRQSCDVVFASSTPLTVGIPGWLAARRRRVPFVFEVRDLWPEAPIQLGALKNPVAKKAAVWLEGFLYRRAAHIVALSPGMADGIAARGVERQRITMIPNASDIGLFKPGQKDLEMVRRWDLTGRFVVGYVGAMGPSNDLGQVVEAARLIAEKESAQEEGAETVFVLAGDGKDRPELERQAGELRLSNIVWPGPIPKQDVPRLLRTLDVALVSFAPLPILRTNSPNKAFDALASGRPIVVNVSGWIADMLAETGAGLGTTPGDPASLADTLLSLRDDPTRREHMGAAARRLAEERFDRKKLAAQLQSVLSTAAGPAAL